MLRQRWPGTVDEAELNLSAESCCRDALDRRRQYLRKATVQRLHKPAGHSLSRTDPLQPAARIGESVVPRNDSAAPAPPFLLEYAQTLDSETGPAALREE